MRVTWHEVPALAGGYLWSIYRTHLGEDGNEPRLCVHGTMTDSDGWYGRPAVVTVIGHEDSPVLKCVTTWDHGADRSTAVTRYYVPAAVRSVADDGGELV